ncbi:MAG: zinc ABC transporter substrate-binding protein [Chloroflexota bacterium]
MRFKAILFVAILLLPIMSVTAQDETFDIVATTTQASDLARILTDGAEGVSITSLMGAGVDPHLYQPTESDIAAMSDADLVVYSGLNLEGQFTTVFNALDEQGVATQPLGLPVKDAGFIIGGFDLSEDFQDVDDPHFWFDPRNWEITVTAVAETMVELDPANETVYLENAEAYIEQLQSLFAWATEGMESVDEDQRFIVTSHDAFQYFGAGFGWSVEGIQGLSTEDEAGVGDIQDTVDFVIENEIPVLFVESSIAPDTIEAVVEAVEDAGGTVRVGVRELYSDAMGEPDTFGGTYIGMIAENVYTVLQSYECAGIELTIPEWPEDLEPVPSDDILDIDCEAEE